MRQVLAYLIALLMILSVGYAHGVRTSRWSKSRALEEAVARIERIPMTVGPWEGVSRTLEDEADVLRIAHIDGYTLRQYTNRQTGDAVSLLIVCGRPGPIGVHTPDVCLVGGGMELKQEPIKISESMHEGSPPAEFRIGDFIKVSLTNPFQQCVYWSWSTGDRWRAPDQPRLTFAPNPFLYKMYVTFTKRNDSEDRGNDVAHQFLRDMMPELEKALGQPTSPPNPAKG